jgi:hypothetical protein
MERRNGENRFFQAASLSQPNANGSESLSGKRGKSKK